MNREELIRHIVTELENYGWAVNEDYYTPVVSDIIEIVEKTGTTVVNEAEGSYKGVF